MNPWPVGVSLPENAFTGPRALLGEEKGTQGKVTYGTELLFSDLFHGLVDFLYGP